jgi:divalent metal cation (Fe/Co/Zn/Cd) transporter
MSHDRLLRSGLRVSIFAAVWTLVASGVGIWIGVTLGSLSLIAFGGVGLLDAAGSITLIVHFRLARSGAESADHLERVAFRVIMAGLLAVAGSTAVVSVLHLLDHDRSEQSLAGALVASASVVVLTLLALRKRWVALRIPSRSLRADGQLSAIGAVLAAVALFGTSANDVFGWWWADSIAALGVATVAAFLGVEMAREIQE